MSLENRIRKLELKTGLVDGGLIYFVVKDGGIYILKVNGADITENVEMTQKEFENWKKSRSDNDCVFTVTRLEDN